MNIDNMASKTIHLLSKLSDLQQKSKPSHFAEQIEFYWISSPLCEII